MSQYIKRIGTITQRRRERLEQGVINDDLVFDNVKDVLPEPAEGRNVLLVSFVLQAALIAFGFLGHHYRSRDFSCCNMWAVVVASLFIAYQWSYYTDWCSKLGTEAEWHRANLFVPYFVWVVLFIMWLSGMMSMLAHTIGREYFELNWAALDGLEIVVFIVIIPSWFAITWMNISIAWAFRNNLATHYYAPGEGAVSLVHLQARAHPSPGSFHYRDMLVKMAAVCGIESSLAADANLSKIIFMQVRSLSLSLSLPPPPPTHPLSPLTRRVAQMALQAPFYLFVGLAYGRNQSAFLITLICIGLVVFLANAQFWNQHRKRKNRKTRRWCRAHLFFPIYTMFVVNWTFFFAIGTMFLDQNKDNQWEDLLLKTRGWEAAYFALSVVVLFCLLLTQWVLANLHRKGWADGTANVDDGLSYAIDQRAMDQAMGRADIQKELDEQRAQYAEFGLAAQAPNEVLRKGPLGHLDDSHEYLKQQQQASAPVVKKKGVQRMETVVVENAEEDGADEEEEEEPPQEEAKKKKKAKKNGK
jgi:hypothetical protein